MKYRKNLRLPEYNYSGNEYYFITICSGGGHSLCMNYREIIEKNLKKLEHHRGIKIDYSVIMPDHVHFIVAADNTVISICRIIQQLKSVTTLEIKRAGFSSRRFWQPNYYEHVIRNDKALAAIREYITNNPVADPPVWEKIYTSL
ncbi:MAG: hypothetical protein A2293_15615 [Elusimicrobia bacterium RIFOXYB2_FULL_49_7]|nr:MAG: hypothetical protein A2293_15615 [Elusimicrobia bacterium RIFOXYB2_FULL_49_7]